MKASHIKACHIDEQSINKGKVCKLNDDMNYRFHFLVCQLAGGSLFHIWRYYCPAKVFLGHEGTHFFLL